MAAALQTSFAGLRLGAPVQKRNAFVSNGNAQRLAMKAKHTFQVEVVVGSDEPQDMAMKRFRREVMSTGLVQEVRRRRYFENSVELKKRKDRESRVKAKRNRQFPPKSYSQTTAQEPSPFSDMFGTPEDIFADVLGEDDLGAPPS
ncbi:hypothetical protein Ndes2437B_g06841 [Nannochloris sp. 'desiccata']